MCGERATKQGQLGGLRERKMQCTTPTKHKPAHGKSIRNGWFMKITAKGYLPAHDSREVLGLARQVSEVAPPREGQEQKCLQGSQQVTGPLHVHSFWICWPATAGSI
jgi:hypothetical protein